MVRSAGLCFVLFLSATATLRAEEYQIVELKTATATDSCLANGLNEQNQVVGQVTDAEGNSFAVMWNAGSASGSLNATFLDAGGSNSSVAHDINESGTVVGQYAHSSGGLRACVWKFPTYTLTDLFSYFGGSFSTILGVNNLGEFSGYYLDASGKTVPFLIQDQQKKDLGTQYPGMAPALNDHGRSAWNVSRDDTTLPLATKGDTTRQLVLPGGSGSARVYQINNLNQAAGSCENSSGGEEACIWPGSGDTVVSLGTLNSNVSEAFSRALALNNFGAVVGTSNISPPATVPGTSGTGTTIGTAAGSLPVFFNEYQRAFIWKNGILTDLNSLLSATNQANWKLIAATGINDSGHICGYGSLNGNLRAFLLKPVSPPALSLQIGQSETGRTYRNDATVGLTGNFNSPSGLVKLYIDGQLVETRTQGPYLFNLAIPVFGTHTVRLDAVDANGSVVASQQDTLVVRDLFLDEWKLKFLGSTGAGDQADDDHDGRPNLLEYALGLDPIYNGDALPAFLTVGEGGINLTHKRRKAFTSQGLVYKISYSRDMADWRDMDGQFLLQSVVDDGPASPTEVVQYRFEPGTPFDVRCFFKLSVSYNPAP